MKRIISILLAVLMIVSAIPFAVLPAFAVGGKKITDYKQGDIIEFGYYPQSKVTDSSLISALNAQPGTWVSYNYYIESKQSDYMKYKDVTYNGNKYRAVTFSSYRPYRTGGSSSSDSLIQDNNGYLINTTYWFKYDPLKWRVLDPKTGYVICENIIDSQAFNDEYYTNGICDIYGEVYYNDKTYTHFVNNWEYSTIRKWLNETFYTTAFSSSERSQIPCTRLTTPASSILFSDYDVGETGDYIFLPSYQDMRNTFYGFSSNCDDFDMNRRAHSSDYAKSQGVLVDNLHQTANGEDTSDYHLRSAGQTCLVTIDVFSDGYVNCCLDDDCSYTYKGIRPALCFNPEKNGTYSHTHIYGTVTEEDIVPAGCESIGSCFEVVYCRECFEEMCRTEKIIPAKGHIDEDGDGFCDIDNVKICFHNTTKIVDKKTATCTVPGYTGDKVCTICGMTVEKGTVIDKLAHTPNTAVEENKTEATCEKAGFYDEVGYCTVCKTEISRMARKIPAKCHPDKDGNGYCDIDNEKITDTTMKEIISSMSVGDLINYGSYPQTDVTDEMGDVLTSAAPSTDKWSSYNYYISGEQSDYMKYYDLLYSDGNYYRGVYFTSYRPEFWEASANNLYTQQFNGYNTGKIYWFRYDSLTWRILDTSTGYVMCENIIDSQAFIDEFYTNGTKDIYGDDLCYSDNEYTHFANNWEYSSIRKWLNGTFYTTAFSTGERSQIACTKHTTPAYSDTYSAYDVGETGDYVFLLTYQDMLNTSYGFFADNCEFDINRMAYPSDYAKSQGIYGTHIIETGECLSRYHLRSAGTDSYGIAGVFYLGDVHAGFASDNNCEGIRPALCFNPSSTGTYNHPGTDHITELQNIVTATCTTHGYTGDKVCTVCGEIVEKGTATEKAAHTPGTAVEENKTEATCETAGSYDEVVYCTVCEEEISRTIKTIPAKGHPDKDGNGYCDIDNEKITDTTMKEIVSSMSVGDLINYGSYPQTDVTDEMGDVLTAAAPSTNNWTSYNYYKNGKKSDYMKYYDLTYNGSRYRGVYFASYRPPYWSFSSDNYDDINIYQEDNGYNINTIYWFRYDPLTWRILEPDTGYVICENIIDSQAFNDEVYFDSIDNDGIPTGYYNDKTYTHFANNWKYSTIRKWLNDIFYATAFSVSERNQIPYTKLTTPAFSSLYAEYDVGETEDYVFLPSYQDVLNTEYGFSSDYSANDINRKAYSSDYAKSQGVLVGMDSYNETAKEEDSSYWALRSSGDESTGVMFGCPGGCVDVGYDIYVIGIGVRPALCFNPSSIITHEHTPGMAVEENKTEATCETAGSYDEVVYCTVCETEISRKTKIIPANEHTVVIDQAKEPTCTTSGKTEGKHCSVCKEVIVAQETIKALGHQKVLVSTINAECIKDGQKKYICSVCEQEITEKIIAPGHIDKNNDSICDVCGIAKKGISDFNIGDTIEFGSYPQYLVEDDDLISELNSQPGEWVSYNYYFGTGNKYDGQMTSSDFMKYKDVVYNGNKYRAVSFTEHRPQKTWDDGSENRSSMYYYNNKYSINEVYWFKYSPIEWLVIDPAKGLLIANNILDAQPFNNYILLSGTDEYEKNAYWGDAEKTYYANNYEKSSIREWLNNDFYNTAFTALQQESIALTTIDNSPHADEYTGYYTDDTDDKIFLPSYYDKTVKSLKRESSTYARMQGLEHGLSPSYPIWMFRTPGNNSGYVCGVNNLGSKTIKVDTEKVTGICPEMCLNPDVTVFINTAHIHSYKEDTTDATCTVNGETVYTCSTCGDTYKKIIYATGHVDNNGDGYCDIDNECMHKSTGIVNSITATCTMTGYTGDTVCMICGKILTYGTVTIKKAHTSGTAVEENKTDATCVKAGSYEEVVYCTICKSEISRTAKTIPAKGHTDKNGDGFCDVDNVNICSHATTKIINEKTATCTTPGYTGDKVCTVCGTAIEAGKTTDKAAHSYTSVVTASTCRTKGYTTYNCKVCGYSYKDNYTDTTAHSYNAVVTAATCRTKGYTTYTCKYCGDSYKANETDYTAHDYRKTVVKPTCTNQGYTMYSCNNCSDSYVTDFVAENGHNYVAKVTPATCQREGYTIFTCTVCGDNYKGNITPIAEHNYHVDVIPATCTEKGGRIYVCKVCDYSYSTVISATGHVDKDQNGFCDTCGENLKNAQKNCSHMCHKKGFMGFLWKIVNFFNKLFKINPYCSCGAKHW